jgi:hypothetical protein
VQKINPCHSFSKSTPFFHRGPRLKEKELFERDSAIISPKVLYIEELDSTGTIAHATGFLIKKRDQIYLVTNYHVVTEHSPGDTCIFVYLNKATPTQLRIFFYRKQKSAPPDSLICELYTNHKRNFISKANTDVRFQVGYGKRQVFDIAFLPINKNTLPKDILIDTINLGTPSDITTARSDNAMISIWGFAGLDRKIKRPSIDTARLVVSKQIPGNHLQVNPIFSVHRDLSGNSGGPVYVDSSDGVHFFGMHSSEFYDTGSTNMVIKTLKDGTPNERICYFLSALLIKALVEDNLP